MYPAGSTGQILLWIPSCPHYSESEPEWFVLGSTDSRDGLWSVGRSHGPQRKDWTVLPCPTDVPCRFDRPDFIVDPVVSTL